MADFVRLVFDCFKAVTAYCCVFSESSMLLFLGIKNQHAGSLFTDLRQIRIWNHFGQHAAPNQHAALNALKQTSMLVWVNVTKLDSAPQIADLIDLIVYDRWRPAYYK